MFLKSDVADWGQATRETDGLWEDSHSFGEKYKDGKHLSSEITESPKHGRHHQLDIQYSWYILLLESCHIVQISVKVDCLSIADADLTKLDYYLQIQIQLQYVLSIAYIQLSNDN